LLGALEALIAKKRAIKQAAIQQLLTGKTRLPGFSGEWETAALPQATVVRKGQLITASSLIPGSVPVIAGGKTPAYFHAEANRFQPCVTVSASGASAGYVALHKEPIFASDCSTVEESKIVTVEFAYYWLLNIQEIVYGLQSGGAQPHVQPKDLARLHIAYPALAEQQAIATVLSDMDAEIAALERRTTKTRAIKQGMMQQLLTGRVRLVEPEVGEPAC
jgi:type I restriction enzyme S subunit